MYMCVCVCTVLLRNNLTVRSRSICVRNAFQMRSERVPEKNWKRVPPFGEKPRYCIVKSRH